MSANAGWILGWISSLAAVALFGGPERDDQLFGRMVGGDARALATLYERISPRAMAVALRVLRDRSEAEDVVQETFVEVWTRAHQYQAARGGAAAWVVTIARNRAIDRVRARGRGARAVESAIHEPLPDAPPSAPEVAGRRRDSERVMGALASLPPPQREVIELAYFDGLSQSEIAARTREPLGTVKTRIRLGMAKLAELLTSEPGAYELR